MQDMSARGAGGRGLYRGNNTSAISAHRPCLFALDDHGVMGKIEVSEEVEALEDKAKRVIKRQTGDDDVAEAVIQ